MLCALCLVASPARAQEEDPGRFEVRSASVELDEGIYYLNAWLEYRLSSGAREALESGVPLTIEIEVEFLRSRRFWLDAAEASLLQAYELQYHALSERYLVLNSNVGEQNSFANLFSALNFLGRVNALPLIDEALLEAGESYQIRLRTSLSTEDFPGPLRLLTFWRRDWSLRSEWYEWPLGD
ncbi:MAG: DUF4390 domain-containing protein [Gammaproteobacteria bacterium]|nr:DUF4390 domain-containing protein [Gammaproteobacteria bacterium]